MLSELKEGVEHDVEWAEKRAKAYADNKPEIKRVARLLFDEEVTVQRAAMANDCIDLNVTGDFGVMKAVFRAFRKAGYEPSTRPTEEKTNSFSTYFKKQDEELKFWLNYSSTVCTRKKVGVKMVEVAVYETVCE